MRYNKLIEMEESSVQNECIKTHFQINLNNFFTSSLKIDFIDCASLIMLRAFSASKINLEKKQN